MTIGQMLTFAVAFLILSSVGGQLIRPLFVYQNLISGVHDYFNNTCILLLHATINPMSSPGLKNAILLRNLQMYFSRDRHIRTAIMDFETFRTKVGQDFFRIKRPLFVILNDEGNIRQLLTNLSSWIKMSYPNWLIFFSNGTKMTDFFATVSIPFDCNFMVSESTGSTEELITESYRVSPDEELRTLPFGTWDILNGVRPPKLTFYQRRNNLFGQVLRVTSIENPPMSTIIRNDRGEMEGVGGLFGSIMEILENKMNCKFEYVENKIWGSMMLNGSWNGMMGSLTDKKVHVAASEMVITKSRLDAVDFTIPIISSRTNFDWESHDRFHTYIQRPSSLSVKWLSYTAPFNSNIWIAAGSLIVVSSIAIVLVESVNFFHERQKQPRGKNNKVKSSQLAETMFAIFGAFCGQGMSHTSFEPSRAIHLAVHMTSVILTAAYSAALISFLTIQVFTMPFTTMEGFLQDGTYRFGVVPDSADYTMFTNTTDKVLRALYEERMEAAYELPQNYLEGLRRVCTNSKYGFMITETMVDALETRVDCILEALDSMLQASLAMAVTKNSAYRGIINNNILLMRDGGIFQRIMKSKWPIKFTKADKRWTSVEVGDIAPLTALLACGVILAGLLLLVERFIFQQFERKPAAIRMLLPAVTKKL